MAKILIKARGRKIYDEARQDLETRGLWAGVDHYLLEAYAIEMQTYYELLAEAKDEGIEAETTTGGVKPSPVMRRMDSALKNAMQLAKMLGLGADSRNKLKAASKQKKDDNPDMKLLKLA